MMDKIADTLVLAMLMARMKLNRFKDDESGMETLEVVILIAIAVVIAGVIIAIVGNKDDGFLSRIFKSLEDAITGIFKK